MVANPGVANFSGNVRLGGDRSTIAHRPREPRFLQEFLFRAALSLRLREVAHIMAGKSLIGADSFYRNLRLVVLSVSHFVQFTRNANFTFQL